MVLASTREGYWAPLRPVATFVGRGATTSGQWNRGGDPNSTALGQYFGKAYGIEFVAVQGVSTEAEPTAEDLAKIVRQARDGHLSAIFLENMADPRLAETVSRESGVRMGGELYADALSEPDGPAPDYLSLVRYNAKQLLAAMQ